MIQQVRSVIFLMGLGFLSGVQAEAVIVPDTTTLSVRSDGYAEVNWTVSNRMNDAATLYDLNIPNPQSPYLSLQNNTCPHTLVVGQSCTFDILIKQPPTNFVLTPYVCSLGTCSQPTTANRTQVNIIPVSNGVYAYIASKENTLVPINASNLGVGNALAGGFNFGRGAGVTVSPDGRYVYFTDTNNNTLRIASAGATPQLVGSLALQGSDSDLLAVSPNEQTIYYEDFGGTISVINIADPTHPSLVKTLSGFTAPLGIGFSPDGSRIYVLNQMTAGTVSVINTNTYAVVDTIQVQENPMGLALSPDGTKLYVSNETSNSVSVINTATDTVEATISGFDLPTGIAVSPDGSKAYVANNHVGPNDTSTISVIDLAYNSIVGQISVTGAPLGIAISPDGTEVFVTTEEGIEVIHVNENNKVTAVPNSPIPLNEIGSFVG